MLMFNTVDVYYSLMSQELWVVFVTYRLVSIKWLAGFITFLTAWIFVQYIPRNMHTDFALLCFVVVIHWLIFPYPSGLLHWHCGNQTIAPVPAKQPWWIWINTSCEFIMNNCITTTKQSSTKPCAYFLGYTVLQIWWPPRFIFLIFISNSDLAQCSAIPFSLTLNER